VTEEQWNQMSPAEQANTWWGELSAMIREAAQDIHYQAGNDHTQVINGLTTVVSQEWPRQDTPIRPATKRHPLRIQPAPTALANPGPFWEWEHFKLDL
jgi:hypothetical protein